MDKRMPMTLCCRKYLQSGMNFQKANATYETQLRLAESDLSTQKTAESLHGRFRMRISKMQTADFLKRKEDASKIENTEKCISTIKEAMKRGGNCFSEFEQKKQEELQNIGYSKEKETSIRERIAELEVYQQRNRGLKKAGSNVPAWRLKKSQTIKLSPHVLKKRL